MKNLILRVIDFFYPFFQKLMPLQTFRYAACGGFSTALDIVLFHIFEQRYVKVGVVHVGSFAISSHIAAFLSAFIFTFPTGFYLSRYVVFTESNLKGRIQLVRYFSLVLACMGLNYMFLKIFIEQMHIEPTVSKILTSVIVVAFSYFSQKHFTFKVKKVHFHQNND